MGSEWDGKNVLVRSGIGELLNRRPVTLELTDEAARKLALTLGRVQQTTFGLMPEVEELLNALNYVLVGDPGSTGAHRRMEAGKGMTPDGGHKMPDHTFWPTQVGGVHGEFVCGWTANLSQPRCGLRKEEHTR